MDQMPIPSEQELNVTPRKQTSSSPGLIFGALLTLVLVGGGMYFFSLSTQQSTESRSRASKTNIATLQMDTQNNAVDKTTTFSLSSDASGLPVGATVRSIDVSVVIGEEGTVLGTSTESRQEHFSAQQAILESKGKTVRLCLSDVSEDASTGKLYWSGTCKGNTTSKNCVASRLELTGGERTLYDAWRKMGKPANSACHDVSLAELNSNAPAHLATALTALSTIPRPSAIPALPAVPPTPQATPVAPASPITLATASPVAVASSLPVKILLEEQGVRVATSQTEVNFSKPTLRVDSEKKTVTLHLHAVIHASQAEAFTGLTNLVTIRVPWGPAGKPNIAKLTDISIKGARPEAPAVELELSATPVPNEASLPTEASASNEIKR